MLRIDSKRNESFRRLVLIKLAIKAFMVAKKIFRHIVKYSAEANKQ